MISGRRGTCCLERASKARQQDSKIEKIVLWFLKGGKYSREMTQTNWKLVKNTPVNFSIRRRNELFIFSSKSNSWPQTSKNLSLWEKNNSFLNIFMANFPCLSFSFSFEKTWTGSKCKKFWNCGNHWTWAPENRESMVKCRFVAEGELSHSLTRRYYTYLPETTG